MFIVIELQVNADRQLANIVTPYNTLSEAQNKFYTICAYAAISDIPMHSAVILDASGVLIDRQMFTHSVTPTPEPEGGEE